MGKVTKLVNMRHEPYDINIGRPSKWGNPFKIGKDGTRAEVLAKFRAWFPTSGGLKQIEELRGKTLGCYCKPQDCHGDYYLEILEKATKR